MRVRWTPAAAEDLQNIKEFLQKHQPHFAQATTVELYDTNPFLENRAISRPEWAPGGYA
jgi:plasmid stabilization system protein ParE